MPVIRTIQDNLLAEAQSILDSRNHAAKREARLELLEAVAASLGGYSIKDYARRFRVRVTSSEPRVRQLKQAIEQTGIEPAVALAALADAPSGVERRQSGAYYTDYRLARRLSDAVGAQSPVLDAACGSGILLAAIAARHHSSDIDDFLRQGVYGADLDALALRATRMSLASLTDDLDSVSVLNGHLRKQDSLAGGRQAWTAAAPEGFAAVVGNPPWERVRPSKYEFLHAQGQRPTYGDHALPPTSAYTKYRDDRVSYASRLRTKYLHAGKGEVDMYKPFLELALNLVRPNGKIAFLVPTGLIRSAGAETIRTHLIESCGDLDFTFLDNEARYFPIDTRFKFLLVTGRKTRQIDDIDIRFTEGETDGPTLGLKRTGLRKLRPDWSIPEVRTAKEWEVFQRISASSIAFDDEGAPWKPQFCREVDMTLDKAHFKDKPSPGALPLLEGRMLGHFTHSAKAYVSGRGRAAHWKANPDGNVVPQFWYPTAELADLARSRAEIHRVGYGEVAGQTNERTLRAAIIPPGVICGNKVPTITLAPRKDGVDPNHLWVALANSFCVDWVVRRLVSTTINMFHLRSTPLPLPPTKTARKLASWAEQLSTGRRPQLEMAEIRARIDATVATTLGLGFEDLQQIMMDFPLLDRGEPPIAGEPKSTITRDLFLATFLEATGAQEAPVWRQRVLAAQERGAKAYRPSFLVDG